MARQALAEDPTNRVAQAAAAVAGKRAGGKAPVEAGPDLNLTAPQPEGEMAASVARDRKLVEQVERSEVQNVIDQAGQQMPVDPDAVIQSLKLELDKIRQTPDLEADVRGQLVDQLQVALREGERRRVEFEQKRQQQQEAQASGKERLLVQDNLARRRSRQPN